MQIKKVPGKQNFEAKIHISDKLITLFTEIHSSS